MNCQECRSLVERFLDHALTGFAKRKVNLHLSRCASCRAYFDRRKQNQALAYRALNAAFAGECLPKDFAGRFLAAHIVPERRTAKGFADVPEDEVAGLLSRDRFIAFRPAADAQ